MNYESSLRQWPTLSAMPLYCCVLQIRCSWYKLCIAAKDATIYPDVVDMLSSQGRMKVRSGMQCSVLQQQQGAG
jgi:hypothetical protein